MLDNDPSTGSNFGAGSNANPKTVYLKDYQVPDFLIPQVRLEFFLDQDISRVQATLRVNRNGDHQRPLVLDGERLSLLGVKINGEKTNGIVSDTSLELKIPGDAAELVIETELKPAENTQLSGLYQSSGNYCTQCEAEGSDVLLIFLIDLMS